MISTLYNVVNSERDCIGCYSSLYALPQNFGQKIKTIHV